jgi:hypothetical protein
VIDFEKLFLDGHDPFDDSVHAKYPETIGGMLPRPAKGYITCPLKWLARVRPLVSSADQLLVLLLLYKQCLIHRSRKVSLSNHELKSLKVSRYTKYRALGELAAAGAITIETRNGRSTRVTLHWFP